MLIDEENIRVQYDSTAESPIMAGDPLPLPFKFVEKTQVRAILSDGTDLIFNQDYTVGYPEEEEPDEDESIVMTENMVVILNIDIPVGETITIYRETTLDQTSEFPQEARFSSRKIEDALDKLTMQNQEQRESLARALKLPLNAPIDIGNLALPNPEPNRSVKWNGQGTALVNTEFDPDTALVTTENYKNQAVTAATGAAKSEAEAIKQATDAKNAAKLVNDNIQSALDKSDTLLNMSRVLPMFTPIWSDHTLNDASFLRADTFSWHSGKIYEAGYETLVAEYNREECVTETEGNVTYKRTPSGFKIADIEQHENVLTTFTMTGKSWFYVLDTEQQRFKLPRTKHNFTGVRDGVGNDVEAGLPTLTTNSTGNHTHTRGTMNITGDIGTYQMTSLQGKCTGAFTYKSFGTSSYGGYGASEGAAGATFNASKSWTGETSSNGAHTHTIPGTSDTVQPPATQMYLYFFVGNYVRPNTDINIGKLVEYINEIDFVGETEDAIKAINTTAEDNLKNINTTTTNSLNNISTTTTNGLNSLTTTKNTCITEINNTGVNNRVLKTGDTMTGTLKCTAGLDLQSLGVTKGETPDKTAYWGIRFNDDTNANTAGTTWQQQRLGIVECILNTDNSVSMTIGTYQNVEASGSGARLTLKTSATGDQRCSFPICTTAATTTSTAATDKVAVVVQNYVNGLSWYRVWSDGWIEQGGGTLATSDQNYKNHTFTFLKSFSNTNYHVVVTSSWTGATGSGSNYFSSKKTNQVTVAVCGYGGNWYACGY